jgi:uncharacterized protein (DUF362 family)
MSGMCRREFIGRTVAAGVGVMALGRTRAFGEEDKPRSVVVKALRDNATSARKIDAAVVKEMVNAAVCKLSGKAKPEDAWKTYVKPDDVVGVKINCLFGVGAATHPEVTAAVVEGVQTAGVPADRVIVWDRSDGDLKKSGYTVNRGAGVRVIGVNNDWEDSPVEVHTCKARLAKILTRQITALINVPILKTHSIAGITCAMKNHYGSFHNPGEAHANKCDPFIALINNLQVVRDKTRLILCDALMPVADGGPQAAPQWTWEYKTIMASTDPLALDVVGLSILNEQRAKIGKPPIVAPCVAEAARLKIGAPHLNFIDIVAA